MIIFCSYFSQNVILTTRCYSIINYSLLLICKKKEEKIDNETFFIIDMKSEFLYKFCCYQSKESHHLCLMWKLNGGGTSDRFCLSVWLAPFITDSILLYDCWHIYKFITTWLLKIFNTPLENIAQIFKCNFWDRKVKLFNE